MILVNKGGEIMEKTIKRTGFVAVVGRPNVGKSSLINALVGSKVSITGPKPQTTRNKILGIKTGENYQIVFVDTPGEIKPKNELGEYMKKSIDTAINGIDVLLIVLDGTRIDDRDFKLIDKYKNVKVPIFVCVNKTDVSKYDEVYPSLAKLNELPYIAEFVSTSAKTGKNIDELTQKLVDKLPEGEFMFDEDAITDKSIRFLTSEIIREKALIYLQEEIPHGIAVDIPKFDEKPRMVDIEAEIVAIKENHKPIIIGKNGDMLKKIGISARKEIEELVGKKVNLHLFVKVRENWQDNLSTLRDFGYDKKGL